MLGRSCQASYAGEVADKAFKFIVVPGGSVKERRGLLAWAAFSLQERGGSQESPCCSPKNKAAATLLRHVHLAAQTARHRIDVPLPHLGGPVRGSRAGPGPWVPGPVLDLEADGRDRAL